MSIRPTGRLEPTPGGHDLILTRTYRAPIEDVWAGITESERTARWFGPWEGDAGPGRTIRVKQSYEEGQPWSEYTIEICDPPSRLALRAVDEHGSWHLEVTLSEQDGQTELEFVHHLDSTRELPEIGPGWDYYLDAFGASRSDARRPDFDDYYPALRDYYTNLTD
ncbi:SRPBCC family protein [Nocardia sp. NBC_01329]|uniref:SRPBCC family protein n=1 Tax=Nocardia sp. NBC_01329 TaxID=2903594 RepID=UPI002E155964|nr:SRPBCC family protein [Nocardia sp. NBC_01329]